MVRRIAGVVLTMGLVGGLGGCGWEAQPAAAQAATTATAPAASGPATAPATQAVRRVHVLVRGKVQGVGFRAFTQTAAREVGVQGWVRNLADGRVEAVAEGPVKKVEALLERVRAGPRNGRVDGVEVKEETVTGEFTKFDIKD